jgi:DNA-damage-inducible protein J
MAKTETIRARVEPTLKEGAEDILKELGLSSTEAITLFYKQVILRRGLPFNVELPNIDTAETLRKARQGKELHSYNNLDELFAKIGK